MPKQRFATADVVRLEIQRDPQPGEYLNLIPNPDGRNPDGEPGGWGWITPAPGGYTEGAYRDGEPWLRYVMSIGGGGYLLTEPQPIPAGTISIASSYRQIPGLGLTTRMSFRFYDDETDGVTAGSTPTPWSSATSVGGPYSSSLPAWATRVALYVEIQEDPGPTSVDVHLADVTMVAYVGEEPAGLPIHGDGTRLTGLIPHPVLNELWHDLTDDTGSISIHRHPGDVSTLTAVIGSTDLDPTTAPAGTALIRVGRRIRVRSLVNGSLTTIGSGTTGRPTVTYELRRRRRKAIITIPATDPWSAVAAAGITAWAGTPAMLTRVIEGLGLPWSIDGSGDQYPTAAPWSIAPHYTGAGKAADNIIAVRDLTHAYAWIDPTGVLRFTTPDHAPAGDPIPCGEGDYNGNLTPTYGDDLINSVTITHLHGETQDTLGPYEHHSSISDNGRAPATFTLVTEDSWAGEPAEPLTFARYVLGRNKDPVKGIAAVTIPLWSLDRVTRWAGIDHYQLVRVTNDDNAYAATLRVAEVHHEITGTKWLTTLTFVHPNRVPVPTK